MKFSHTLPRSLRAGLALCACLLIITAAQLRANAQTCDTCPPPDTQQNSWQAHTPVTVNINPYFTQDQRNAIMAAFDNWQNSSNNTTGVTFTYTFNSTPVGSGGMQVNYQTPSIAGAQAETFRFPSSDGSHLDRAVTNIDPRVTNLTAMTEAMAHEIGHTMGINDCDSCCAGASVMTGYNGDYNDTTSGRVDPGPCDTTTANQTLGTPLTPAYGGGGGGGDYTGGGGYDYCTPYYWYYYTSYDGGETWNLDDVEYAGCW
jgi:hypothetical protein